MAHVLEQVRNGNPTPDGIFAGMNHLLRTSDPGGSGISALAPAQMAGRSSSSSAAFYRPFILPEVFTNTKHRQRGAAFGIAKTATSSSTRTLAEATRRSSLHRTITRGNHRKGRAPWKKMSSRYSLIWAS
jgi:hypothetical protein